MFSHTVGSLFILMLFLQKLFILMRSRLFILSFMSLALGDMFVRLLLLGMSEIFLPKISSRTFWCYDLYLSLLSTLNYFCVWCKLVIEFHFFACSCSDFPTPFVEEAIFTPFYDPASFVKY